MNSQARIGFVTLIILVGCILAIPHFRHPTNPDAQEASADTTDLTLKITVDEDTADTVPAQNSLRQDLNTERTSVLVKKPIDPPATALPEIAKFPPLASLGPRPEFSPKRAIGITPRETQSSQNKSVLKYRPPDVHEFAFENGVPPEDRFAPKVFHPTPRKTNDAANTEGQVATQESGLSASSSGPGTQPGGFRQTPLPGARLREESRRQLVPPGGSPNLLTQGVKPPAFQNPIAPPLPPASPEPESWHRVVNGDTLEKIAQTYYGDPRSAMVIFEANRRALFNPAILPIGLDLKIPPRIALTRPVSANPRTTSERTYP